MKPWNKWPAVMVVLYHTPAIWHCARRGEWEFIQSTVISMVVLFIVLRFLYYNLFAPLSPSKRRKWEAES
jgi:hypothetical protein